MINLEEHRRKRSASQDLTLGFQKSLTIRQQALNFLARSFHGLNLDKCINRLAYGETVNKITRKGKGRTHPIFFHIYEDDNTLLQWISKKKESRDSRIDLRTVTNITEVPTVMKKKWISKYDPSLLLSIHYGSTKELMLYFENKSLKDEWWCGLQYFVEKAQFEEYFLRETSNEFAKEIFARADRDSNKVLDKKEIKQIFRELHISVRSRKRKELIEKYDYNNNGTIDFDEFKILVKELLRKQELVPLFKKYCPGWLSSNFSLPAMTLLELQKFFLQEQKQDLSLEEVRHIHPDLQIATPTKPSVSFDMFGDILFSGINSIFNLKHSVEYQKMNRPMTDYYVNSSHNTYLMGHQLIGVSSVHAYISTLNMGCKSVELDLWNGPNGEPLVCHGYTMTSKLLFKDVIIALRDHAFRKSPYPIVLSFENHLDLKNQQRAADILKEELGDLLFCYPENFADYEYYPSLESLKRKFIAKGKGFLKKRADLPKYEDLVALKSGKKRSKSVRSTDYEVPASIKIEDENIYGPQSESSSTESLTVLNLSKKKSSEEEIELELSPKVSYEVAFEDEDCMIKSKNWNVETTLASEIREPFQNWKMEEYNLGRGGLSTRISKPTEYQTEKDSIVQIPLLQRKEAKEMKSESMPEGRQGTSEETQVQKYHPKSSEYPSVQPFESERKALAGTIERTTTTNLQLLEKKKHKKPIRVIPELNGLYGLIACKMSFAVSRTIWEISSIDEGTITKLARHHLRTMIDFHKKHVTRIYPSKSRIDSSNFDPIPAWSLGSQSVALNYQTHDENMLINHAKFAANGDVGYVLKPKYLRHDSLDNKNLSLLPQEMRKPVKRLTVKVISGQQLRTDKEKVKDIVDPYVEIKIRGLEVDELHNTSYKTQTIKDNGFHPVWETKEESNVFQFTICVPDFCFLVFNVYDEDLVGREKIGWYAIEFCHIQEGYRIVPILNNLFQPIKHSYLFCHITIENL